MTVSLRALAPVASAAVVIAAVLSGCDGSDSPSGPSGAASADSGAPSAGGGGTASSAPGPSAHGTAHPGTGGSGSTSRRPQAEVPVTAKDPCKITSATQVTEAFGGTVITVSAGTSGTGASTCHYVLTGTRAGTGLVLDLSLTRDVRRSVFTEVKKQAGNQNVDGVGQDAYYRTATKSLQVYVRGSVAAMQAAPTKSVDASRRAILRRAQVTLGKNIAAQS